jgi:plasmid stabilization system protein ParE
MSHFLLADDVHRDLGAIWDYIGIENHSPTAAQHVLERLYDAFVFLAKQPLIGERRDD